MSEISTTADPTPETGSPTYRDFTVRPKRVAVWAGPGTPGFEVVDAAGGAVIPGGIWFASVSAALQGIDCLLDAVAAAGPTGRPADDPEVKRLFWLYLASAAGRRSTRRGRRAA